MTLFVVVVAGGVVVPPDVAGVRVTVAGETVLVVPAGVTVSHAARGKTVQVISNNANIFLMIFLRFVFYKKLCVLLFGGDVPQS